MATLDFDQAAHLLRRMGFAGPPEEIDALVPRGREGAVDYLLNYNQIDNKPLDDLLAASFDFSNPRDNDKFNQAEIRRWWYTRMVHSRRQFEEKMTLFWHNHFATSLSKVEERLMYVQNLTLRAHALDRFDTLLLNVSQDPAMLIWLDGITNVLGSPNENWGRELQELFTMGINDVVTGQPNYSENDVKEIARAFTGGKFRQVRGSEDRFSLEFLIVPNQHDNTAKTIYGQTALFSWEDVITLVSAKRATARFLVKEIFEFFVYPLTSSSADKATINRFADVYESKDHSIKDLMRAIFVSDEFFSSRAVFGLIKQPAELVVGAVRMLGGQYAPGTFERRGSSNVLYQSARVMGQDLFNPPDVNGWDLHLAWINTATMLDRFNFSNSFLNNRRTDQPGMFVTNEQLGKYTKGTAKKTVKKFLSVLGPLGVTGNAVSTLKDYLLKDNQGNKVEFAVTEQLLDSKIRGLAHQIMCLPEFQLN
ncbi:MAG TPA: DUF1800 domain-containing protein [Blastocatellia bacterium]|nr:DUF1800 domain-containing protein [Blastocatellia bacterium]